MNIYLVNPSNEMYGDMFINYGWAIVNNINEADLVVFTGGPDVSPELYSEGMHPNNLVDTKRDEKELEIYEQAQEMGLYCVGICRGAQFLHVMNGGSLLQDVDNHTEPHLTNVFGFPKDVKVSSTHHQMMFPNSPESHMVVMSNPPLTTKKEKVTPEGTVFGVSNFLDDVESIYYPDADCLCFQPHPEHENDDCRRVFFYLIRNYLFQEKDDKKLIQDCIPF